MLTKGLNTKGPARKRTTIRLSLREPSKFEVDTFKDLQEAFRSLTFLLHYNRNRILYVNLDVFKVVGFAAIVYYVKGDPDRLKPFVRTNIQPIIFFSRCLNVAEYNYQPTELKVVGVIQVVKKIRYIIKANLNSPIVLYTNYFVVVPISR